MGVHCDCIVMLQPGPLEQGYHKPLIAPRPLMFVNSDNDVYFPMAPNERLQNRLERIYALFGASDLVESILSMGGHGYRTDIRRAVYGFFNRHFKMDARRVEDPDAYVTTRGTFPINPVQLRVFPTDADLPKDQLNTRIDELFVARGKPGLPTTETFEPWRRDLLARLKKVTFAAWPASPPPARAKFWLQEGGRQNRRKRHRIAWLVAWKNLEKRRPW